MALRDFIDRWYRCQEVFKQRRDDEGVYQFAQMEADDLYAQINGRQELKDMAKNPLLLTMMATFHRRFNGANIPRQRVKLYQEICNLQLQDRPGDRERRLETVLLNCEFADSWLRLMLLYVGLVNPTKLIREALQQNKPDLADQLYRETTKQIDDPSLIFELENSLKSSVKDSKYAELERLLNAGEWKAADGETYRLMITTVGKEEGEGFSAEDLETFPCEDLLTIDRLWVKESNGHFGFSVQKKIWENCGSPMSHNDDYKQFMDAVGWGSEEKIVIPTNDFKFSTSHSLLGELPGFLWWVSGWMLDDVGGILFSRATTCKL